MAISELPRPVDHFTKTHGGSPQRRRGDENDTREQDKEATMLQEINWRQQEKRDQPCAGKSQRNCEQKQRYAPYLSEINHFDDQADGKKLAEYGRLKKEKARAFINL